MTKHITDCYLIDAIGIAVLVSHRESSSPLVTTTTKKESDDGSDESTPTRSKSQPVVRRNKEYRYPTHRWSQFKISFDNDSVRLESEMHPLQSTGGAGGSGGERAAGSLSTGPSGALMTTSSSISAAGGTMAPSAASTVPPTIKIIGKEVSRTHQNRWAK